MKISKKNSHQQTSDASGMDNYIVDTQSQDLQKTRWEPYGVSVSPLGYSYPAMFAESTPINVNSWDELESIEVVPGFNALFFYIDFFCFTLVIFPCGKIHLQISGILWFQLPYFPNSSFRPSSCLPISWTLLVFLLNRGAGFISLENLLFFAKKFSTSFQSLLRKQTCKRAVWEYPFAVAGVNITFMLVQMLDLNASKPGTFIRAIFLQMLAENEWAFDLLYCVAFVIMDNLWLQKNASYMDFNDILKSTRYQLEKELLMDDITWIEDMPSYNLQH